MTDAKEGLDVVVVRLVAAAAVKWKAVGGFVTAAAASPFVAVPGCAACEVQNTKNN